VPTGQGVRAARHGDLLGEVTSWDLSRAA
jgi:hypothetical protein